MDPSRTAAGSIVTEATLRLSKSPTSELAAAALRAQKLAGIPRRPAAGDGADFIVLAVPSGQATPRLLTGLETVARLELDRGSSTARPA